MKKAIYLLIILFLTIFVSFGFMKKEPLQRDNSKFELNIIKEDTVKFLRPVDLNVKSFFNLFTERFDKSKKLNLITLSGRFPENWVKNEDVEFLMSIIKSEKKCCSYVNVFSSFIPTEEAEVGGFAIIFLNSLIENKKIDLGLVSSPRTDLKSIERIEKWYLNQKNK